MLYVLLIEVMRTCLWIADWLKSIWKIIKLIDLFHVEKIYNWNNFGRFIFGRCNCPWLVHKPMGSLKVDFKYWHARKARPKTLKCISVSLILFVWTPIWLWELQLHPLSLVLVLLAILNLTRARESNHWNKLLRNALQFKFENWTKWWT